MTGSAKKTRKSGGKKENARAGDLHWIQYMRDADKEERAIKDREIELREKQLELERDKAKRLIQL